MNRIRRWLPAKLRNRIFLALLVIVFLPFTLLQLYNYGQIEKIIGHKISQQNVAQLELMKDTLNSIRWSMQSSIYQLEHDELFIQAMETSEQRSDQEMKSMLQEKLAFVKSEYLPNSLFTHYTLVTPQKQVYHSFLNTDNKQYIENTLHHFSQALSKPGEMFVWQLQESDDLYPEVAEGSKLLTLYSQKQMANKQYMQLRVSIDLPQWLANTAKNMPVIQNYYLFDKNGNHIAQNSEKASIEQSALQKLLKTTEQSPDMYVIDSSGTYIYNAKYAPAIEAFIVGQFPLNYFIGDIHIIKKQAFLSMGILFLFFTIASFLMISGLTRPLQLLEVKMKEAAEKRLNIKLPEQRFRGEILSFIRTFNDMIDNINELIKKVKLEERQKEASRFQLLLMQMNPHFLLNTLNAVKWNASNFGDETTAEMCRALGKILESSMYTEKDLVLLEEEISLLQSFVYIQKIRYDHRFAVQYDIAEDVAFALVPKFSLQPIVENAILHGLVYRVPNGLITVAIYKQNQYLILKISDNGIGMQQSQQQQVLPKKRQSIALNNLRERLALLYRTDGQLSMMSEEEGTTVTIQIPLLISTPYTRTSEVN